MKLFTEKVIGVRIVGESTKDIEQRFLQQFLREDPELRYADEPVRRGIDFLTAVGGVYPHLLVCPDTTPGTWRIDFLRAFRGRE